MVVGSPPLLRYSNATKKEIYQKACKSDKPLFSFRKDSSKRQKIVKNRAKNLIIISKFWFLVRILKSQTFDIYLVFENIIKKTYIASTLVHNHPSGFPDPSVSDIQLTKKVARACALMDFDLLDHIIIGDGVFASLQEKGLM